LYSSDNTKTWAPLKAPAIASQCVISHSIVFKDALYLVDSVTNGLLKTSDGITFTNVLDDSDSLAKPSRRIHDFFIFKDTLYAVVYTVNTNKFQLHTSSDGDTWHRVKLKGWIPKHTDEIGRGILLTVFKKMT
jgi:hypothetical protein